MGAAAAAEVVQQRGTSGVTVLFKAGSAASRAGVLAAAVSESPVIKRGCSSDSCFVDCSHRFHADTRTPRAAGAHVVLRRPCRAELVVSSHHC